MSGIKHLSEIYKKQGSDFLNDLFSKEIVVSEKLNGMSFSFERNPFDGTIYFYKRDQNNPISKIDRVLMNYYDEPINYIKNLPNEILDEIPSGWRFGMEFFINTSPVVLSYQNLPKNGLVLTHIIVKNQFGDVERTMIDQEELDYWADKIGVEKPPIIFQGKLTDEQKVSVNDFINSPNDVLNKVHGTESFAKYLITVLNPTLNKSFLNNSLDEPIEGVVFRFGPLDGVGDSFTTKILDPIFSDITKQNNIKKNNFFPNDIYGITILEVMNFILDKGIDSFTYSGDEPNDKYISYICSVFNSFIEDNGDKYLGLDFQEPEYLTQINNEINLDLIGDQKTKEILSVDESYQSLFRLILSAFRKLKKKPGGFFTMGAVEQFNLLVREISEYLNRKNIVVESMIPTFDQFRKEKKVFVPQEEIEDTEEDQEIEDTEPEVEEIPLKNDEPEKSEDSVDFEIPDVSEEEVDPEIIDRIKAILSKPVDSDDSVSKDENPVNIIIGKFQPFNNGHEKVIKKAHQTNGHPVCVFVTRSGKSFIDQEIMKKMMDLVSSDLSGIVSSVLFVDDDLLSTAVENLPTGLTPKTLTVGKNKVDNYLLQSRMLKKKVRIPSDFQIQSAPEWVISNDVMNSLKSRDYLSFKKSVPKSIHSLWEELSRNF